MPEHLQEEWRLDPIGEGRSRHTQAFGLVSDSRPIEKNSYQIGDTVRLNPSELESETEFVLIAGLDVNNDGIYVEVLPLVSRAEYSSEPEPEPETNASGATELVITTKVERVSPSALGERISVTSTVNEPLRSDGDHFHISRADLGEDQLSQRFVWEDISRALREAKTLREVLKVLKDQGVPPKGRAQSKGNARVKTKTTTKTPNKTPATGSPAKRKGRPRKNGENAAISVENVEPDSPNTVQRTIAPARSFQGRPGLDLDAAFLNSSDSDPDFENAETVKRDELDVDVPPSPSPVVMDPPKTPRKRKEPPMQYATPRKQKGSPVKLAVRSLPTTPHKEAPDTPRKRAYEMLHSSAILDRLPGRAEQFSQIFLALESAITAGTGSVFYASGPPGTGKTSTVRDVIAQLKLREETGEIPPFTYLEINAMRLTHPEVVYELLWKEVSEAAGYTGRGLSASNALAALEKEFASGGKKASQTERAPLVVVVDELDQLATTRNNSVIYNLFDWPSRPHSRMIVVAIGNSLDLPERDLQNKIASRLGLIRVKFDGYDKATLAKIIKERLNDVTDDGAVFGEDPISYISGKIAGISGDARAALELARRAVDRAGDEPVTLTHVRLATSESNDAPIDHYLKSLAMATKIFLCAVLAISRTSQNTNSDIPIADVLFKAAAIAPNVERNTDEVRRVLLANTVRYRGFQHAVAELVQAGVLAQQAIRSEAAGAVRLRVSAKTLMDIFKDDPDVRGII